MTKFEKGDAVARVIRYGAGLEKLRLGVVEKAGHRGPQVKWNDNDSLEWVSNGAVKFVLGKDAYGKPVLADKKEREEMKPHEPISIDAMIKAGVDPFELLMTFSRSLVAHTDGKLAEAQAEVAAIESEVKSAEDMLHDAKERLAVARKKLAAATHAAEHTKKVAGGG